MMRQQGGGQSDSQWRVRLNLYHGHIGNHIQPCMDTGDGQKLKLGVTSVTYGVTSSDIMVQKVKM